ncbi:MAG: PH domain-containing protein, partial [Phycisphaerales bacterium]
LSKTSLEMVYRTIQDIEIQQSFANRIFNVGTMTIANASSDDDVVVLHDLPQPYRIRQIIDAYRPM